MMRKRVRLCPEITDPGLRSFLDMVPAIRSVQTEVVMNQKRWGETKCISLAGRDITVCIHRAEGNEPRPAVFEFHGGGFVLGNAERDDKVCREISRRLNCHVIGVNYRLAPEYPYPAAFMDACDTIGYFAAGGEAMNIDKAHMAVLGYSGGATLASAVAMWCVRDKEFSLCGQVLHYPYLDSVHLPEEKAHFDCDMDPEVMRAFTLLYSKEEERGLSCVSPLYASEEELSGTAPACILMAERDSLCAEGLAFAERLRKAGVPVYSQVMPDTHHGYIEDWANQEIYELTAEDIRKLHSPYSGDWAQAAVGISCTFLENCFTDKDA